MNFIKQSILFLLVFSLLVSCDEKSTTEDEVTDIAVTFKAKFDNQPLVQNQSYAYGDANIRFTEFNFYVSELNLTSKEGLSTLELEELLFLDFGKNNVDETSANEGITMESFNIPIGTYDGIGLGLGVPADLNKTTPAEYAPNHVLSLTSHYWTPWSSYIFAKIEGQMDTDKDGTFDDVSFAFHMGKDEVFRNALIANEIDVRSKVKKEFDLTIDLKNVFFTNNTLFDISTNPTTHDPKDLAIGNQLMTNLSNAISFE